MKPIRATSAVTAIAWMCGSLFALYLVFSAKLTASVVAALDGQVWTSFLVGVPWYVAWLIVAAILGGLAWGAALLARTRPWVAYAYAVLDVAVLAVLYWLAVVGPTASQLVGGL
jgi:hypothetical protein